MKNRYVGAFLVALLASALAVAQAPAQTRGGTLVYARGGEPSELDPALESSLWPYAVMDQIFDGLIAYEYGRDDKFVPGLAERWNVSPDGKTWTFHLRRNVRFHDGTPFDADAVLFSFNRIIDSKHPFHKPQMAQKAGNLEMIQRITAPNRYTVRIQLKYPSPIFEIVMATYWGYIVSPTAVRKHGDEFALNPVGTGPFRFKRWVKGSLIELEAYNAYWGGRPLLDRVVFRVIPEGAVQLAELEAGRVHIVEGIAGDARNLTRVKTNRRLQVLESNAHIPSWLGMVTSKPPLNSLAVRKAINYAIDKKKLAETLFYGAVNVQNQHVPPFTQFVDPSIKGYEYAPETARRLLREAGYPRGFSTKIYTENVPSQWNLSGVELATAIQGYLSAVGIKAEIVPMDPAAFTVAVWGKSDPKMEMYIIGFFSIWADISNYFKDFFKCNALGNAWVFCDPSVDKLIDQAGATRDRTVRARIYGELQRTVQAYTPAVFLFTTKNLALAQSAVQGYKLGSVSGNGLARLDRTWIRR